MIAASVTIKIIVVSIHITAVIIIARHVGLLGVEHAKAELNGAFATKPVGRIAGIVRLIVASVGLCAQCQRLAIANR